MSYINDMRLLSESYTADILGNSKKHETEMSLDAVLEKFKTEIEQKTQEYQTTNVMEEEEAFNQAVDYIIDKYAIKLSLNESDELNASKQDSIRCWFCGNLFSDSAEQSNNEEEKKYTVSRFSNDPNNIAYDTCKTCAVHYK